MNKDSLIITQLIYINPGMEGVFLEFEESVLKLLPKYNGKLLYRIRPGKESFVYSADDEQPFEVHVVSFNTKEDFNNYKNDPERQRILGRGMSSIKKVFMIEGSNKNGE